MKTLRLAFGLTASVVLIGFIALLFKAPRLPRRSPSANLLCVATPPDADVAGSILKANGGHQRLFGLLTKRYQLQETSIESRVNPDCRVAVVKTTFQKSMTEAAVDVMRKFLDVGGSVFVIGISGTDSLLADFGSSWERRVVFGNAGISAGDRQVALVQHNSEHQITDTPSVAGACWRCVPLKYSAKANINIQPLLTTTTDSFAVLFRVPSDLERIKAQIVEYDVTKEDTRGPFLIALAAERRWGDSAPIRLIVTSDEEMLGNDRDESPATIAKEVFTVRAIDWLMGKPPQPESVKVPNIHPTPQQSTPAPNESAATTEGGTAASAPETFGLTEGEKDFLIDPSKQWTQTRVWVKKGMRLKIEASGTVRPSADSELCEPEPDFRCLHLLLKGQAYTMPSASFMTLIAKIGEDGEPFKVGARLEGTVNFDGWIFLGANGLFKDGANPNYTGGFRVNVSSYR